MHTTESFFFGGYDLVCCANATLSGRYYPSLVVMKRVWPTRPRTIDLARESFSSKALAIDAARCRGIEWVTEFG
jgi:hypothetical protein